MSTDHPVIRALSLLKKSDEAFSSGEYTKAVSYCDEAIKLAMQVPAAEWDRQGFLATCSSRLAAAHGASGRLPESLYHAEEALQFFDRFGDMYPVEFGQWFGAKFNKGTILVNMGRVAEGLKIMEEARSMLPSGPDGDRMRASCDAKIATARDAAVAGHKPGRKWWKFW